MSFRSSARAGVAGLGLAVLAASFLSPVATAAVSGPLYVALGDSYTSAPLISKPVGTWGGPNGYNNPDDPYTCGKSDQNYPHLIAAHLGLYGPVEAATEAVAPPADSRFLDASCGSAKVEDMYAAQDGLPGGGSHRRQLDALDTLSLSDREGVRLVSVGIGGNDLGFGELQDYCIQAPAALGGTPCRVHYENGGADIIDERLAGLAPKLAQLLDDIHAKAPNAEVLIFGYPALLPEHRDGLPPELSDGCYPYIPILPTDAAYLRDAEQRLNATIAGATTGRTFAHYVDWYTPSIGHDMCAPPGIAWVNGAVLVPPSYPVHPNLLGTRGAARAGVAVLEATKFTLSG